MAPSPQVRRFATWLRFTTNLRRWLRGIDTSDALTVLALILVGAGLVMVVGVGWAVLVLGIVLALMTPIGAAVRLFLRGR